MKSIKKAVHNKNDNLYTPKILAESILPYVEEFYYKHESQTLTIWCPFDTADSEIVIALNSLSKKLDNKIKLIVTHISNGDDFFTMDIPKCDLVVSNPPFSRKLDVLKRLEHLEREYRLQHIERTINIVKDFYKLKNLPIEYNSKSYDEIEISENSIIYCDIPYRNSESYDCRNKNTFNYDKFYDWCLNQDSLVFVSEYNMPESEFIPIWEKCKTSSYSATNNSLKTIEKVFIPKHQKDKYFKSLNNSQHNLFERVLL